MYVSPTGDRGIVCPPRTASRSVRDVVLKYGWKTNGHHVVEPPPRMDPERVACLVRDHRDVFAGFYCAGREIPEGFAHWFNTVFLAEEYRRKWIGPTTMFMPWLKVETDVLHFETLTEDLEAFIQQPIDLPHVGYDEARRAGRRWEDVLGAEGESLVVERYRGEMQVLGYA